jgi:hypothetical protein
MFVNSELETIVTTARTSLEQFTKAYQDLLSLVGADGQVIRGDAHNSTILSSPNEVRNRFLRLIDLISALPEAVTSDFLPQPYFTNLSTATNQLLASTQSFVQNLNGLSANGGVGALGAETLVVSSKTQAHSANFAKILRNINVQVDAALEHYLKIAAASKTMSVVSPDSIVSELTNILNRLEGQSKKAQDLLSILSRESELLQKEKGKVEKLGAEVDRLKAESEKSRKSIAEYEADGLQKLTQLKSAATDSAKLLAGTQVLAPNLEDFSQKLDERTRLFAEAKSNEDLLIRRLKERESEVARLNASAEAMLKGATVAGLASSFGEIRDKVTGELKSARRSFYWSLVFLAISVLPLVVYVVPGLGFMKFLSGEIKPSDFELGQVIVRALLLIPGIWFARFAAARHSALFRLREHYEYKYSIAASVEGFKMQAPTFKDEIAATAFRELAFNPADKMDGTNTESGHPNPVTDWLLKKMGITHDGKAS